MGKLSFSGCFFFICLRTILFIVFFFFAGGKCLLSVGGVDNYGLSEDLGVLTNFVFGLLALNKMFDPVELAALLNRIDSSKLSDLSFLPLLRYELFIFLESLKLFELPLRTDVLVLAESALTLDVTDFFKLEEVSLLFLAA